MRRNIPKLWFSKRAVRKFMPGEKVEDALAAAEKFRDDGIPTLFTKLGENVTRPEQHEEAANHYNWLIEEIHRRGIRGEVSVKLTHLAMDMSDADMQRHMNRLCETAAANGNQVVWIDMEGSDYTDKTLAEYSRLKAKYANVGLCLQAYLRRTERDLTRLIATGARMRLVKGAFVGTSAVAFTTEAEIKANYRKLVALMLSEEARESGFYPIIATHDDRIQAEAVALAQENGWPQGSYEFEMLLGVRSDVAEALARQGERVRLYVPFGRDWWPYAVRRIGENPANGVLLARSLLSRR